MEKEIYSEETVTNDRVSSTIGHYIDLVKRTKDLGEQEEKDLISRAKTGDVDSKDKLFSAYIKTVISIAKMYSANAETIEDLIQEGVRGLDHAVEKFDFSKKVRFYTYARFWVRAYILKYFSDNVRSFKIPTEISIKLYGINKAIEKLSKDLLREPTNEELAAELQLDESYIAFLRKYLFRHFSLDAKVDYKTSGDKTWSVIDNFPDDQQGNADEHLITVDGIVKIREALKSLTDKERSIIEERYGFNGENDGEGLTLAEVGEKLNLTAERIRQIQQKAEAKLKRIINK